MWLHVQSCVSPQRFAICFWYDVPSTTSCHKSGALTQFQSMQSWLRDCTGLTNMRKLYSTALEWVVMFVVLSFKFCVWGYLGERKAKWTDATKHVGEYLSRVCRSSNRPAANIQVIASPHCVHLDRWSYCDICAARAGTRFTIKGGSSQTGIFCVQVMLANMFIQKTSLS